MSLLRTVLAIIGFGGALLFGAAFAASYARPVWVEEMAKEIVQAEVEARVQAQVAEVAGGPLAGIAAQVVRMNEAQIARAQRLLADSVQAKVARISAEMRECACRDGVVAAVAAGVDWRIAVLSQANDRLTALIRAKYADVAAKLTREFRIFTAANALVLLMLGLAVVVRRNARLHLLPAASVLMVAALAVGYTYLFEQDWMHTILFGSYVGYAYFAWLGLAFAFLGEVILNRGRITAKVLTVGTNVLSGFAPVLPC